MIFNNDFLVLLYFWKWPDRIVCHGSLTPCQYTDRPNDNKNKS